MLDRDGYLALEEITAIPGYPGEAALADKKCVVIECAQNIPCNPCEVLCPHRAIKVGTPITNLPVVDPEKCIGCGLCVAGCPGQAIFLVDQTHADYDAVTLPYEYYPLPKKGDTVCALSRDGRKIADGEILKVITTKRNDRTSVIEMKVPKGYGMLVRSIATDENHMATGEAVRDADPAMVAAIDDSTMYVCRCEEITKCEVLEAVRNGATSVNEVKRILRPGMGLCQGRNCARTIEGLIARELNVPPTKVAPATKRGPVRPIKMSGYTTLDVVASAEFYEHDW